MMKFRSRRVAYLGFWVSVLALKGCQGLLPGRQQQKTQGGYFMKEVLTKSPRPMNPTSLPHSASISMSPGINPESLAKSVPVSPGPDAGGTKKPKNVKYHDNSSPQQKRKKTKVRKTNRSQISIAEAEERLLELARAFRLAPDAPGPRAAACAAAAAAAA
eukprot:CAMPEP_0194564546 /NCGR_PEP_ID=MMETSP0292-20121207/4159_1 /TAXON_ID=39354 /ORGANISM="Heterosigma akashiwo, Strain CCMP2393" /LENGTH=159 /DNA_ID=CAMNT_0039413699 /DNA_START=37 /DNA_END=512 /DNA_ORIENTATION=+